MARPTADYDLTNKTARLRLAPRPKPYFRKLAPKRSVGYIRIADAAGIWVGREWLGWGYTMKQQGHADDLFRADGVDVLSYDQVTAKLMDVKAKTAAARLTVADALERYFARLASKSKHAKEYQSAADKRIVPVLGRIRIDRLTKTEIENWLAGLVRKDRDDDAKRRSRDTANRHLTILKAALNEAFADEANRITSDKAWRVVRPFQKVARPREADLEPAQVRLLIAKAATFDAALARLLEASYLTGARMGELAGASVRDLDPANRTLRVDGKTGARVVSLTAEAAGFLHGAAKAKHRDAPLLPNADGDRWQRSAGHQRKVKRAAALAKLPANVTLYTLRHAHVSRAIDAGMPLSLVAKNLGTSLRMIEANYAKVLARTQSATIEKTAPKLRRVK